MWARLQLYSNRLRPVWASLALAFCLAAATTGSARAITPLPTPAPGSSSYGLEATKRQPPPTTGATISTPGNGSSYSTSPITVSGLCPDDLLVQVYDNGVLVGAVPCKNGSFSLQITLFTGQNDITAIVFDDLDQAGPESNKVTVSYNNASFSAFGALITLTSNYARRAANPGSTLSWPILLSGGTGPYAFSIDWGDGTPSELKSQPGAGEVNIGHVYSQSGVYQVTVKVTDVNGVSAFIQLVAIANGSPSGNGTASDTSKGGTTVITKVLWVPAVACLVLLLPAYWLGRRSELVSLHKQLEKDMANYKEL